MHLMILTKKSYINIGHKMGWKNRLIRSHDKKIGTLRIYNTNWGASAVQSLDYLFSDANALKSQAKK